MNLSIRMVDTDTGEILYNQDKILACQFTKNDTAFNLMFNVIRSCVRGIRYDKAKSIELKIRFCEPKIGNSAELPFQDGDPF